MKTPLFLFLLFVSMTTTLPLAKELSTAEEVRLSQPVISDSLSETFGKPLDTSLPKFSLSELAVNSDKYLNTVFTLETRIAKVCQKKGCFFIAQEGKHSIRVAFRDYGFFIPTGSSNKMVTLNGNLIKRTMDKKQADHFNSDVGDGSAKLAAGVVYEIVADSVRIPKQS